MPKGKKRKSLKGLGAKYGFPVRKRYTRIHRVLKAKRRCPSCGSLKLKRSSSGLWRCRNCNYTVAGGGYNL